MEAQGYKISADGRSVMLPDGRSISGSDLGNDSALEAAGFSPSDIEAGRAALAEAQAKATDRARAVQMQAEGGGGGGGSRGLAGDGSGSRSRGGFNFNMPGGPAKDDKTKLSGMSKNFGSDKIGVAGDNIFEMITRRYKARDAANNFLKAE